MQLLSVRLICMNIIDPQGRIIIATVIEHGAKLLSDSRKFVECAELEGRQL